MKNFNFVSLILLGLTSTPFVTSTLATTDPLPSVDIPTLNLLLQTSSTSTSRTSTKLASTTTTSAAPTSTPSSVFQQDFATILGRRLPLIVSSLLTNTSNITRLHPLALMDNGHKARLITPLAARRVAPIGLLRPTGNVSIILIPKLVGQSCILLGDSLNESEASNCSRITLRSYSNFGKSINGVGELTGANTLDVASVGIDYSLITGNGTVITDAFRRIHDELVIMNKNLEDGIRADGSFGYLSNVFESGQHTGVLYNGNYGKDFVNDILGFEIEAAGTQFAANKTSKAAFATLIGGDAWMIYSNAAKKVLHWDFSALGRFISFPVIDQQATGSINVNLSQVQQLGQLWNSNPLISFATSLSAAAHNANAGGLTGHRVFFNNDYVVCSLPSAVFSHSLMHIMIRFIAVPTMSPL
ncbi:hypothetical protein DXG03_005859 [Asterophora parasitica]|uniref:Polysaccharide lyase 8 N-terminal alpha-helical domain-containing protein n=1 Tax=Asterophora parasitica TaxID=117018 RepID=A0A9P7K7D4_9AGAR|nr:hypothetical protein DXG03_005859 [Asterophora parasitica]